MVCTALQTRGYHVLIGPPDPSLRQDISRSRFNYRAIITLQRCQIGKFFRNIESILHSLEQLFECKMLFHEMKADLAFFVRFLHFFGTT